MAALAAARGDTRLAGFWRSLCDGGKSAEPAPLALARKRVVILDAVVRDFHARAENTVPSPVPE